MFEEGYDGWEALVRAARDLGLTPTETREWLREMRKLNETDASMSELEAETDAYEDNED